MSVPSAAQLVGKVALITGASSGIGAAIARTLADAGAAVALVARRHDRLQALAERITAAGGRAIAVAADIAIEEGAVRAVAAVYEALGHVDILVNAAGIARPAAVERSSAADWLEMLNINLLAAMYMARAVIPSMRQAGDGLIVNVTSAASRISGPNFSGYCASKSGAAAFSDAMRHEVGPTGIRVTVVEPGPTETEIAESVSDPAFRKQLHDHVHRNGTMRPEDIARAVLYIALQPAHVNVRELWIVPTK